MAIDDYGKSTKTPSPFELPPADTYDPVIEAYKKDVDRTLLRENLKLTPAQRIEKFQRAMQLVFELRRSARVRRGLAP
jgi:hypothetical protein